MLCCILFSLIGFFLLIKGGDCFVDGASGIARRFRLPELLIGATVVSIGTTLPEVMVSLGAAVKGSSGISYGNAIGSVICNTSLIAALTIAIRPGPVGRRNLALPSFFFFAAAFFYALSAWICGRFSRWQGIVLLCVFVVYMASTVFYMKKYQETDGDTGAETDSAEGSSETGDIAHLRPTEKSFANELLCLILGAVLIATGSDLLVDNAVLIAAFLGVPESVIGLTMVALGTSLPELTTAVTSLLKGHGALSLGNVIGANLFNIVLVSGLSVTIAPFSLPEGRLVMGMNSSLILDLPLMFLAMLILTVPALLRGRLYRWQGIVLLVMYTGFSLTQILI